MKKILLVDLGGVMGGVEYYIETLSDMLRERANLVLFCVLPSWALRLRQPRCKSLSDGRPFPAFKALNGSCSARVAFPNRLFL